MSPARGAALLALIFVAATPAGAGAVTFNVNTTADGNDFNTADAFCDSDPVTPGEQCTLRAAIQQAATPPGQDTISVPAGDYALTLGSLVANSDVIVDGAGAATTTIRGTGAMRVLLVNAPEGRLDLRGVTVRDGVLAAPGAGIYNETTLILRDSVVKANDVTVGFDRGGGIYSETGTQTTILDSVIGDPAGGFAGNRAEEGGGIFSFGDLTIRRSRIVGNTASGGVGAGGGINSWATTVVEDSVFTANTADNGPGGSGAAASFPVGTARVERTEISDNVSFGDAVVYSVADLELRHSTLSGNTSLSDNTAGIRIDGPSSSELEHVTLASAGGTGTLLTVSPSSTVTLRASVFDAPVTTCFDFSTPAAIVSLGFNVENKDQCGLDQPSDRASANPLLEPLSGNGGPGLTHALRPGSVALDLRPGCSGTDQRGVPRPQGLGCDSGSFELARCGGVPSTHVGTAGADTIVGTPGPDVIVGFGGNDVIRGRGGNDVICAGPGNDRVFAGFGNDRVFGGPGHDRLLGQGGFDRLFGGAGADRLFGGARADRLFGGPGPDRLFGGPGFDRLFGGAGRDRLFGGPHLDRLFGGPGNDLLNGGAGRDRCFGGPGRDRYRRCAVRR